MREGVSHSKSILFPSKCVERGNYSDKISNYGVCLEIKREGHLSICISLCILEEFSKIILDNISYNPFPSEKGKQSFEYIFIEVFLILSAAGYSI